MPALPECPRSFAKLSPASRAPRPRWRASRRALRSHPRCRWRSPILPGRSGLRVPKSTAGAEMRSIDYFDRGHDLDPGRACLIDTESGERLSFAEVKALTERIATVMYANGFENQAPVALYGPNSAAIMVALLAIWR